MLWKKPEPKVKSKKSKIDLSLNDEQKSTYENAIKSTKTKFDSATTFFEKGKGQKNKAKGAIEYANLIAESCLSDITVEDKQALKRHNDIVKKYIFDEFKEWFKNQH